MDDIQMPQNGLHAALVLSTKAHARILSVDDSSARCSPGFAGIFSYRDVPGNNCIGPVVHDEELFASEIVTCVGQVHGTFTCFIFCAISFPLLFKVSSSGFFFV